MIYYFAAIGILSHAIVLAIIGWAFYVRRQILREEAQRQAQAQLRNNIHPIHPNDRQRLTINPN
jgi:Tfp pilus assembly protein PilO